MYDATGTEDVRRDWPLTANEEAPVGLDVYVGTLTRYYAGDWAEGRDQGAEAAALQPAGVEPAASPSEVRRTVLVWRDGLSLGLQAHLESPLDWDESADAPYFAGRPGWDGYAGLLLWAAYAEHPELPRPHEALAEWEADSAFRASNAKGFASRYGHLLYGSELWLPCEFGFTFRADDAWGNEMVIGSSIALLAELRALNAATWGADTATLRTWRAGPPSGALSLESCARFGFALFLDLAERAVDHGLPMVLSF